MAFGSFINSLKGIFTEGPLKDLTEEMAQSQPEKLSAEQVVITDAFRSTFNVNSPVRENMHNSFMLARIVKSDANVTETEIDALRDVAVYIGMKVADADALLDGDR